jgi:MFS family permease
MRFWPLLPKSSSESSGLDPSVWKITAVAVLGSFLSQLDATIVNVSLSSLAVDLHSSLTAIQWVTSGYLLALALMLPLNGWLVERIGAKSLYLWCFSVFTLSSALCGLAWSANSLIAFRILQGMSGGLMSPMTQMMMARAAGKHMARLMGYAAVPILMGPILGPVIAGAILQHASWRWLFLVNLPVGVLAIALAVLFLPNDREETRSRELDLPGFALLSPGLVLFLYGSDHLGKRTGLTTLLISIVLLAAFFRMAIRKGDKALIDLQLFKRKTFSASAITQFMSNGISFAGQTLIPIYLTAWSGHDLFLSMDGSPDAAVRDTKGIGWRRISGLRSHAAIYLAGQSRTCNHRARMCSLCAWDRPQRGRHSLHLGCIRFCEETGPANGDNLAQHCAASRRADSDYPLRNLSGMEVGAGTVQRQPLQRIYRCLCSSLRTTCFPVCRRVETSVFHRQSDGTTRCRGTVCPSGTYVRVIVRFHLDDEAITLQTNACMRCVHAIAERNSRTEKFGIC